MLIVQTGCFYVVKHEKVCVSRQQAVVIDDNIYIVDVKSGEVSQICPDLIKNAKVHGQTEKVKNDCPE
jgi:hypothetical protein